MLILAGVIREKSYGKLNLSLVLKSKYIYIFKWKLSLLAGV